MSLTIDERSNRLSRTARRAVLAVHILGAGAWIGIDVVLGCWSSPPW